MSAWTMIGTGRRTAAFGRGRLVLFTLLGQMIMISANNLLLVYLGVELLSLSLYAAVAMQRDNVRATEAAMKYFVLGAMASGMLLYGMSMIYGATGSLQLAEISAIAAQRGSGDILLTLALTPDQAEQLIFDAKTHAQVTKQTAEREVADLTRQRDAVTNQLSQLREMLSGLAGVGALGGDAKPAANGSSDDKANSGS